MDFIPFPTLKEYLFINRVSMSLQTKLMLILNVVQAIRSTDAFDVVHLDLKPNNILLNPDLKIKLIDFG
jgi:serine/threonine protein kinase